ncbi:cell wall-binding repeat-containing protein [Microbacterium sp. NPDC057659]|uniref:cell wall-binding repeat-containing protein n=1 Tax=Microbacterium sp. NPDC057659 TaxID=3346198 RepID=UPI003671C2B3
MKLRTLVRTGIAAVAVAALVLTVPAQASVAALTTSTSGADAAVTAAAPVSGRLYGAFRYDTALAVSRTFVAEQKAVFIATGENFPDALSASTAAAKVGGPVLLTKATALWPGVLNEVKRLSPERIYVLGGPTVISTKVADALKAVAPIERIYGTDRYETSRKIVKKFVPLAEQMILATGRGYADALVAGAAAGRQGIPVMLVDGAKATLDTATRSIITASRAKKLALAGGYGAISIPIEQSMRTAGYTIDRLGGATRYDTAAALTAAFGPKAPMKAYVATGEDFPDALAAGALVAQSDAVLTLARQNCMPRAERLALAALPDIPRIAIGGTAVVSNAAVAGASCGDDPAAPATWNTGGFTFRADVDAPYYDRRTVDVHDPAIVLDSTGLRVLNMGPNGSRVDHPVAYAQYGMSALAEYQETGDTVWLDRATRHAERLIQIRTERDGAWFYPYLFDWAMASWYRQPWWSGMAQGEALSLFVRMYEQTGDETWRTAADHTWKSLTLPQSAAEPWARLIVGKTLWIEEYAGRGSTQPMRVLNGHIFALFGVYDYWRLTQDPDALRYLDGATASVLEVMPKIRVPGGISYYCWQVGCATPRWQNKTYHPIHSWQLDTLARLTGDPRFSTWAATLRKDWAPLKTRSFDAQDASGILLPNDEDAMAGTGVSSTDQ